MAIQMRYEASKEDIEKMFREYMGRMHLEEETGEMIFDGIPAVIVRSSIFYRFFKGMYELMGASAYSVLSYIGNEHGRDFYDYLKSEYEKKGNELTPEEIFRYTVNEMPAIGWGRITIEDNGDEIVIEAPHGFVVGGYYKNEGEKTDIPVDAYFLGYFTGLFSKAKGVEFKGEEVECVAKGDPRCLMVLKKKW